MLEFPHTIIGAAIGTKISNPLLAFFLSFISNFVLDMLPHWNPHLSTELIKTGKLSRKTKTVVLLDALSGLVVGTYLSFRFYPNWGKVLIVLFCCFFAVLADLLEAPYFFLGIRNRYLERLIQLQKKLQWNVPMIPGILSQVILLIILFKLIYS